eukprot:TRINITY_DN6063_c0_g1_i1.p1 TRINITY_DN6063_c0_g1~~TRINITY_DN6063_c0_g1_i1.p1  ORF type:complete len:2440 (+),score=492.40 TRINITY_DN6063_c0_g1_i1:241-7560(+)
MTTIDRHVRALLHSAAAEKDEQTVHEAYNLLTQANQRSSERDSQGFTSFDLYVICAEVAIQCDLLELASSCLTLFYSSNPSTNQYLCRAYYCRAQIEGKSVENLKGPEAIQQCLYALSFVMQGLTLVQNDPKYQFLVYNGSVVYWQICRPLMQDRLKVKLIPTMALIVKALEDTNDSDYDWRVRYLLNLARCYDEAKQADDALRVSQMANSLCQKQAPSLRRDAFRVLMHVSRVKADTLAKARAEAGNNPDLKALSLLQQIKSGVTILPQQIEKDLQEATKLVEKSDDEILAEIGLTSLFKGFPAIAETCAKNVVNSKSLRARVFSELIYCELMIRGLGDTEAQMKFTKTMVNVRIDTLKRLEKALTSSARTGDETLVEDTCLLIWNTSLPLLQANLRSHVKRPLEKAAAALEEIRSQYHRVRVQIHLELSKCQVDDDLLVKARQEVEKGLLLDYPISDEEFESLRVLRPLDRFLEPLKARLDLRTRLYVQPERPEEQAMLLIDQARDAKENSLKATLLERAIVVLQSPLSTEPGGRDEKAIQKERAYLWIDIIKTAWKHKMLRLVRKCMPYAYSSEWDVVRDKDLVRMQAEVHHIHAETLVMESQESGEDSLMIKASNYFIEGVRLGLKLQEDYMVINGCIYLWNYFVPFYKSNRHQEIITALEEAHAVLTKMENRPLQLYFNLTNAYVCGLEQIAIQRTNASMNATLEEATKKGDAKAKSNQVASLPTSPDLKKAEDICRAALLFGTPMQKKDLLASFSRICRLRGILPQLAPAGKGSSPVEVESQIIIYLEQVTNSSEPAQKKKEYIGKVNELLREVPVNVELLSKAGKEAFKLQEYVLASEFAKTALTVSPKEIDSAVIHVSDAKTWRWFSICEELIGKCLLASIDPSRQEKGFQDQLRQQAINHFATAAKYASKASVQVLILSVARNFWNAATAFMMSPVTRQLLLKPLQIIVENLPPPVGEESESLEFRVSLYKLLFECYSDQGMWKEGVNLVARAFQSLPQEHHKALWEAKISFLAKVGKDVAGEMFKIKEYNAQTQARVWVTVARASPNRFDQLSAYQKAIQLLGSHPMSKVDYMIEFGEWLYCNNFPIQDAQDQLQAAADILLDAEHEQDNVHDDLNESASEASHPVSASLRSVSTARSKANSSRQQNAHRQGSPPSRGDNGSVSSKSGVRSRAMSRGTMISQATEDMHMEKMTIQHYEMLSRIYLMLARMSPDYTQRIDNCFLGYTYFMKMWEMSVENANLAEQDDSVPEKQTKSEFFVFPEDLSGWVDYTIPTKLRQRFKDKSPFMINRKTINKPELLYWYLMYMVECLKQFGYYLHCCPVLLVFEMIAEDVMSSKTLANLIRLEFANIVDQLNLPALSHSIIDSLGSFELTEATKRQYMEEIRQRKQIKLSLEQQAAATTHQPSMAKLKAGQAAKPVVTPKKVTYYRILRPIYIHEIWLRQAILLYDQGQIKAASELLQEVRIHADTYDDETSLAECIHLQAKIAYLQGNYSSALEIEELVLKSQQEIEVFIRSTMSLIKYMAALDQISQAKIVLQERIKLLVELQDIQPNCTTDILVSIVRLRFCYADLLLLEAKMTKINGTPYAEEVKGSLKNFMEALQDLSSLTSGPLFVESVLRIAESIQDPIFAEIHPRTQIMQITRDYLRRAVVEGTKCLQTILTDTIKGPLSLPLSRMLVKARVMIAGAELYLTPFEVQNSYEPIMDSVFGDLRALISSPRADETRVVYHSAEERALVLATTAFNQTMIPKLHAEAYMILGRCMAMVLAKKQKSEAAKLEEKLEEGKLTVDRNDITRGAETTETFDTSMAYTSNVNGVTSGNVMGLSDESAYIAQIQEILKSSISIAVREDLMDVAVDSCFQLFNLYLEVDPSLAAEFLILGQSCFVRRELTLLFRSACEPSNREELFRKLMDHLRNTLPQPSEHPVYKRCQAFMQTFSISSKYLDVRTPFQDIITALLPNTRYLILHTIIDSEESSSICGTVLGQDLPTSRCVKKTIKTIDLENALTSMTNFKYSMQTMSGRRRRLKKRDDSGSKPSDSQPIPTTTTNPVRARPITPSTEASGRSKQSGQKGTSSNAKGNNPKSSMTRPNSNLSLGPPVIQEESDFVEVDDENEQLETTVESEQAQFGDVVNQTENILSSVFVEFKDLLFDSGAGFHLVIVADSTLQQLPLESLSAFKKYNSVTRDFSLHMHQRRLAVLAEKKGGAMINKGNFGYIVDPRNEDNLSHRKRPSMGLPVPSMTDGFMIEVVRANPFAKDWKGMTGIEYLPSPGEWQQLLRGCSQFIYYGFGRPLAFFDPKHLVSLNLDDSNMVMLLDLVLNDIHYFQQMKLDNLKSEQQRTLENPISTAVLFSLQGCKSIILNQWGTTVEANYSLLLSIFRGLKSNKTTSEALHQLFRVQSEGPDLHESVQNHHRYNPIIYGIPNLKMDTK